MNKKNVLFISEKWSDGKPNSNLTNSYHNFFSTFKYSLPEYNFNLIHYDECFVNHQTHIDKILPKIYNKYKPDIVFILLLLNSPLNPSMETIEFLKKNKCFVCFLWPDIQMLFGQKELMEYNKVSDLHVSFASEGNIKNNDVEIMWMWTPEDKKLYYPNKHQDIPVSFIGSTRYKDRQDYLNFIISKNIPIAIEGGQREKNLTAEQYASLIRRSQITLNFSQSPGGNHQLKGRVFEATASKCLLMENKNDITPTFFEPNKEYIQFDGNNDLVEKLLYYITMDKERNTIAENGFNKYQEHYKNSRI